MSTRIAFIGAGIATSYTIIPLLDKLEKEKTKHKIELLVIDKSADFFKGMPYGERSGKSVLLIQDIKNFISEPYRTHFKNWLNDNISELVKTYTTQGGHYAQKWVGLNKEFYEKGAWDDLYIPRFFFGEYIEQEVLTRIERLEQKGVLKHSLILKEALALTKEEGVFHIQFMDNSSISVDKVVLSLGSLPYKKLHNSKINTTPNRLYIEAPYQPGMEENLNQIKHFVSLRKDQKLPTQVLVLGANASGLEMVYKICDTLPLAENDLSFTVLSSHGMMPDGAYDEERAKLFSPKHLQALLEEEQLTAEMIAEAANRDIDTAEEIQLGAATTVGIISNGFGRLLPKLTRKELLNFACFHGNQIGQRQRCAGQHYLSVIDELKESQKFNHLKGRFAGLSGTGSGLNVTYISNTRDMPNIEKTESFHIVVNCLGSENLESKYLSGLLKGLMDQGLCTPNPSKIGFHVNENLEASENLFVAGPLLAGNQIEDKVFWHLEHCVRIIWSSSVLSNKIMASIDA